MMAIEDKVKIEKIMSAFEMTVSRVAESQGGDRGKVAAIVVDYFMGMLAGCLLQSEDSIEEISKKASGNIAVMGIASFTNDEKTIARLLSRLFDGEVGKR